MSTHESREAHLLVSARSRSLFLALLLAALVLLVYQPVLHYGFVGFDDQGYVTSNFRVQAGLTGPNLKWAFRTTDMGLWHPLTWLAHMLDWQLFGANAAGHHAINLLIHLANVLLLFACLVRYTGAAGRSFAVAALFAVHPINIESVAWIAERKNMLSMFFFLLCLLAYFSYVNCRTWKRYAALIILFALGLMAKPALVPLPVCLVLLDYWPLRRMRMKSAEGDSPDARTFLQLVYEKLPLVALSACAAVITIAASRSTSALASTTSLPIHERSANALVASADYLAKAFVPRKLAVFYPLPVAMPVWEPLAALALLAFITFIAMRARRHRYLLVGWLWFLAMLLPVSGIFQNGQQLMADRYAYFSFVGIFIAVVWLFADLAAELRLPAWSSAVALALIVAILVPITHKQLSSWRDGTTLFAHALAVTADNAVAEDNLGAALASAGRVNDALPHFQRALALTPNDPIARFDYGTYLLQTGRPQVAVEQLRIALASTSNHFVQREICDNLGAAFAGSGDLRSAQLSYAQAAAIDPYDSVARRGLEMVNLRLKVNATASRTSK